MLNIGKRIQNEQFFHKILNNHYNCAVLVYRIQNNHHELCSFSK